MPGTLLEGFPWPIERMGRHGTLFERVPWPIEVKGPHGTNLEAVPWQIEGMVHSYKESHGH